MIRSNRYLARQGSWVEPIHELIVTEDHPAYMLAAKFCQDGHSLDGCWRFTFSEAEWVNFIQEANGHILSNELEA